MKTPREVASKLFGVPYEELDERARKVAQHIAERRLVARNVPKDLEDADATPGQRAADAVAKFGGSWTFIAIFLSVMVVWIASNTVVLLLGHGKPFDPYPFILLNLVLSMVAAFQAPVILMSQNRQSYKDRVNAEHDYEVNLKAEIEIMMLHEKLDHLRERQWADLLQIQQEQIEMLRELSEKKAAAVAS